MARIEFDLLLDNAREFARSVIAPNAEHWESLARVPYEAYERAGELGLCGLMVPPNLGGQGLDVGGMAAVTEILASACMSATFSFVVHNNLAAFIAKQGSEQQRERYLPDMLAGRKVGAFLLTEPQTGSDAQSIQCHAQALDDTSWRVDGAKAWVSNGSFADILSVYVQTKPGSGAAGIAAFLIETSAAGIHRTDNYELMRGHALGASGIVFDNCIVDTAQMVLAPGDAFKAALGGINTARINVAAMCCGMTRNALSEAIRYADARQAFGQSTLEFQGLQWILAEVATELEAASALTEKAIANSRNGTSVTVAAAHAKKYASRMAFKAVSDCMQAMGAAGFSAQFPLARHLAAAKMAQFLDGTSEIQNIVIARALKSDYAKD